MNSATGIPNEPDRTVIAGIVFTKVSNPRYQLGIMDEYEGIIPELIKAAKAKGMRFEVSDFPDGEIIGANVDCVTFRGSAAKLVDRILECPEGCLPGGEI